MSPDELLIAADTTVHIDGDILGKPRRAEDAVRMLSHLSGRTHQVITGVSVFTAQRQETFSVSTDVKFATLTDDESNFYVDNYLPLDKAGAYGIQEWIGLVAVEQLNGSFFNVMGLPVQRLYTLLKTF